MMATLDAWAASLGLAQLGSWGGVLLGILILLVLVKILSMPFKLVWNGILGAVMLYVINLIGSLVGFSMKITVIKALIAGFFGIPGAIAVVLFEIFA